MSIKLSDITPGACFQFKTAVRRVVRLVSISEQSDNFNVEWEYADGVKRAGKLGGVQWAHYFKASAIAPVPALLYAGDATEPAVQLTVKPVQAEAIIASLDAYTRLCLGQLEEVANLVRHGVIPMAQLNAKGERQLAPAEVCEQIGVLMDQAKALLGYPRSGCHGIGHPHVAVSGKRAYEVEKVLAKVVSEQRDPNPKFRGVNYDGLGPRFTTDPAPVATVVRSSFRTAADNQAAQSTARPSMHRR